ncbi:MAG TPA: ABC transporter permease [Candidatus Dormibacteraeota bacterium]|nr:ABC transporter permease [Candidatus Dormibacteraeota bacterium]
MRTSIPAFDTTELAPPVEEEIQAVHEAAWRQLLRHRSAVAGLAVLAVYTLAALLGPVVFNQYNPAHQDLNAVLLPPSPHHLLGTDNYGRDELLDLVYGSRYTLSLGLLAVVIGGGVGVPLGAASGYFGGWIDILIQRLTDIMLAFPNIVLALALVAALGPGLKNVVIAVGVSSIPNFIRLVRSEALKVRQLPYVEAARALGVPSGRILFRHLVPNALAPVIVLATLQMGLAILVAAGLGFFGLGVQPPTPEWGELLGEGHNYIFRDANLITFPGLCIFFAVLAFNLVGDGLRDVLDPRLRT